jgi:hypothetical protein
MSSFYKKERHERKKFLEKIDNMDEETLREFVLDKWGEIPVCGNFPSSIFSEDDRIMNSDVWNAAVLTPRSHDYIKRKPVNIWGEDLKAIEGFETFENELRQNINEPFSGFAYRVAVGRLEYIIKNGWLKFLAIKEKY